MPIHHRSIGAIRHRYRTRQLVRRSFLPLSLDTKPSLRRLVIPSPTYAEREFMYCHSSRVQQLFAKMWMPGDNVHEIAVFDPEERFQGEEFGPGFVEERLFVFHRAKVGDARAGLLIAEEAPERAALGRGHGTVGPGGVCGYVS